MPRRPQLKRSPSRARGLVWLFALFAAPGCKGKAERTLTDTEQRTFTARCEGDKGCAIEQRSGPPAAPAKTEIVLRAPGRLIGICNARDGAEPESPADCRALVCESSQDCPPAQGLDHGECLNGLCIEPAHGIGPSDAVLLCLAGTGLGRETARQVERYALALNCGSPCKIPSPCRQP
jgi:hypothetical protein